MRWPLWNLLHVIFIHFFWHFKFSITLNQTRVNTYTNKLYSGRVRAAVSWEQENNLCFQPSACFGLVWWRVQQCNAASVSGGLAGLLTALLSESRERRELYLISSYVSFSCAGFSRKCSLANVLLCTPTHRRRWKRGVVSQHTCTHPLLHTLSGPVRINHFLKSEMTPNPY